MAGNPIQGPSSSATPYLDATKDNVTFISLLTSGDAVAGSFQPDNTTPWRFVGIPDGLGAIDNGDGTATVLVNHEIGNTTGIVREHGSIGSFVSRLTIDIATFQVLGGEDLAKLIFDDQNNDGSFDENGDGVVDASDSLTTAIGRLCSGDLPDVTAFFNAATGLGTTDRIYLTGEEVGPEGRAYGFVVTGDEAGNAYRLADLARFSWENSVANPTASDATVVISTDDATPGQVYVYVGEKQATGVAVERAGLVGGITYGIKAEGIGNGSTSEAALFGNVPLTGNFSLVEVPNARGTGTAFDTASDALGVSEFWRPEDGQWDTVNPNRFYFATTAQFGAPSRLWALDFVDGTDPTLGGTFTAVLDGTEGQEMFDNLTVDANGLVWLQEDPGTNDRLSKVWVYDPVSDRLVEAAQHDPARFGPPAVPPFNTNEESSGIIDVTDIWGDADTNAYLLDVQAHFPYALVNPALATEIVEGGQLLLMLVDDAAGSRGSDLLVGNTEDEFIMLGAGDDVVFALSGDDTVTGGRGNDLIEGNAGSDSLAGGTGDDTIAGGTGNDTIRGGDGADMVLFASTADGGDTIRRFAVGEDKIGVSASGFGGGLVEGPLDPAFLVFGTSGDRPDGQFFFNDATNELGWDSNGTTEGGITILAMLTGPAAITASDIVVFA